MSLKMPPLLARGRDADIFDLGGGLVLRRARNGRSLAAEAAVMAYAHAHGVPTPAIHDVTDEGAIVMDRVDGPTMLDLLQRGPWRAGKAARAVAAMHERVHAVAAPPELPEIPEIAAIPEVAELPENPTDPDDPSKVRSGGRLLHLDLHPANIIISEAGPILIDWANARSGPAGADLAMTWVLMATGTVEASWWQRIMIEQLRGRFLAGYLAAIDRPSVARYLPAIGARRIADRNVTADEAEAVRALLRRVSPR